MDVADKLFSKQIELEASFKREAEDFKKRAISKQKEYGEGSTLPVGTSLINYKLQDIIERVAGFVLNTVKPRRGVKPAYTPIIYKLTQIYKGKETDLYTLMAYLTISTLLDNSLKHEYRLNNHAKLLGTALQNEVKLEAFLQKHPDQTASILQGIDKRVQTHYREYYVQRRQAYEKFAWVNWGDEDKNHLGTKLIEIIIETTGYFTIFNDVTYRGSSQSEVRPTQWLLDTWDKNEALLITKAFRYLPTIILPKKWVDMQEGAYYGDLAEGVSLLRRHDLKSGGSNNSFSREYLKRLSQVDISAVCEAVNAIQETPWCINHSVLEIAQLVMIRGGEMGGLPKMSPLPELPRLPEGHTEEALKAHKDKAVKRIELENRRIGQALRAKSVLKIAEEFRDYERIYFPHNMDFRGRVYPIPSFSPQGDDLNKGLIELKDTPPLKDNKDVEWMMIHGANLAGVDKVSFEERIQWVRDNEEKILAVATDPMEYLWWADLDCPFQFLAFCFEWKKLKDYLSIHKSSKGFITGICVAFDGTCSGLQHFSALLRDPIGAKAVNLIPSDKPQDIYGLVADKVNERLKHDAQYGTIDEYKTNKNNSQFLALGTKTLAQQWLVFGVNRKVTKRSVMTLAYGSKEYGFRDQIMEDTLEPARLEGRGHMFTENYQATGYMAKLIWESVQAVVVKAVEGMAWLQKMARLVTKNGRTVTWVTPMGLPIQQAYMERTTTTMQVRILGRRIRLYNFKPTGNIDKRSQASGIAPNFIHSLDAAHLQLTVGACSDAGMKHFAMIHDSYGTSVAQAGELFRTVRETFVKMYEENDIIEKFTEDMSVYFERNEKIPKPPTKGNLNLKQVLDSPYTFA